MTSTCLLSIESQFIINCFLLYRVSSSGERTEISRKEYKCWAFWYTTKSEQSLSGEIFVVFQDISDNNTEVNIIDVDLAAVNTKVSQDEGESSSAHIKELEPDHSTHETSPTALSQKELDLAVGFLNNLGQEHLSSIVAEPIARTVMHHSPCVPSHLVMSERCCKKAAPPGSTHSLLALVQLLRPRGIVESNNLSVRHQLFSRIVQYQTLTCPPRPPQRSQRTFLHQHPYHNNFLSCKC
jgi:hypothetical protein